MNPFETPLFTQTFPLAAFDSPGRKILEGSITLTGAQAMNLLATPQVVISSGDIPAGYLCVPRYIVCDCQSVNGPNAGVSATTRWIGTLTTAIAGVTLFSNAPGTRFRSMQQATSNISNITGPTDYNGRGLELIGNVNTVNGTFVDGVRVTIGYSLVPFRG